MEVGKREASGLTERVQTSFPEGFTISVWGFCFVILQGSVHLHDTVFFSFILHVNTFVLLQEKLLKSFRCVGEDGFPNASYWSPHWHRDLEHLDRCS